MLHALWLPEITIRQGQVAGLNVWRVHFEGRDATRKRQPSETSSHRERRPQPRRPASHRQLLQVMFWQSPQRKKSGQSKNKANQMVRLVFRPITRST